MINMEINGTFAPRIIPKLKPCPFCGNQPIFTGIFESVDNGQEEVNSYYIGCNNCNIGFYWRWDYEYIVEKWNTRKGE